MARGNHTMDGMVCSPAIIEPTASRIVRHWTTAIPTVVPMTRRVRSR